MELSEVRKEIDAIDSQLLSLFKQRMNCARQVAEIKAEKGLPILNPGREEEILNRRASEAGELGDSARVLFSTLMELSRSLQHQLLQTENPLAQLLDSAETVLPSTGRIACQGIADAYSHKAALRCFPGNFSQNGKTFSMHWNQDAPILAFFRWKTLLPAPSARFMI